MKRSEFIKTCMLAGIAGTALVSLLESCTAIHYAVHSVNGNLISVKKSEFIEIKKDQKKQRSFVVIRSESFPIPVCIYRIKEDEFVALNMLCTHQGCELNPNEFTLTCPCHGSEFSNTGKLMEPPADRDLDTFKTTTDDQYIYVHLK